MEMIRTNFSRYELPELIDARGYKVGAEIGVNLGQFSYHILKYSKLEEFYAIDAYAGKYKRAMKGAVSLLDPYMRQGRCCLVRKTSVEAANELSIGNAFLNFLYIDAAHDKKSVAQDLEAWWPLMLPGGLFSGHDYVRDHQGVVDAVNEFVNRRGLQLKVTREAWGTWMIEVPQ